MKYTLQDLYDGKPIPAGLEQEVWSRIMDEPYAYLRVEEHGNADEFVEKYLEEQDWIQSNSPTPSSAPYLFIAAVTS